jgi:hypothetical protein
MCKGRFPPPGPKPQYISREFKYRLLYSYVIDVCDFQSVFKFVEHLQNNNMDKLSFVVLAIGYFLFPWRRVSCGYRTIYYV